LGRVARWWRLWRWHDTVTPERIARTRWRLFLRSAVPADISTDNRRLAAAAYELVEQRLRFELEIGGVRADEATDIDGRGQFVELLGFERLEETRRNARVLGDFGNAQTTAFPRRTQCVTYPRHRRLP